MDFHAPEGSTERRLFEESLRKVASTKKKFNARFLCEMATRGKVTKTNHLTVSIKQIQSLGIAEELFGPATATLVTRHQLAELAHKIYSSLNIVEEYEMTENKFSETFILELISQSVVQSFNHVPLDEALKELSKFGTNFNQDLESDTIQQDLGSILEVKEVGGKSHIVVNNDTLKTLREKDALSVDTSAKVGVSSFFVAVDVEASVKYAKDNERDSSDSKKTLNDQLSELNDRSQNDIKWEIKGNKVIPKSISVAKMSKSSFEKSISFQRIRRVFTEAAFSRKTSIYTLHSLIKTQLCLCWSCRRNWTMRSKIWESELKRSTNFDPTLQPDSRMEPKN
jgi:hypothetical protein